MGIRGLVRRTLENREDRRYRQRLRERQTVYGEWAAALEAGQQAPMEDPEGDFAVFCAGKGRMARGAWEAIGAYFAANPQVWILYGDEDVWGEGGKGPAAGAPGERRLPWYKPDWSPDVLDSFFYFGSLVAIRGKLLGAAGFAPAGFGVRQAGEIPEVASVNRAFYEVTDVRVYEKAVQACVELAGGYERAAACVGHVGRILFHAQGPEEQDKFFLPSAVREKRRQDRLLVLGGMLERHRGQGPFLSVVIPSKDHPEELKACVEGCVLAARPASGAAGSFPFEIVLVDKRLTAADVALDDCQTDRHTYDPDAQKRVNFTYSVPEASSDLIELSEDAATITAKKPGNAAVEIKAEYQYEKAQGEWETITNTAGVKAEKTITVTVNVTKEGAADPEDILALGTLVTDVKEKFPAADEGDYTPEAWKNLQDALKEAEGYTAAGSGATAAQVSGVTAKINQAVAAMAAAKSEKGLWHRACKRRPESGACAGRSSL